MSLVYIVNSWPAGAMWQDSVSRQKNVRKMLVMQENTRIWYILKNGTDGKWTKMDKHKVILFFSADICFFSLRKNQGTCRDRT